MACFSPFALRARWPAVISSARSVWARASGIQLTEGSTVVSAWVSLIRIAPAYPASPLLSSLGVVCGEERPNESGCRRGAFRAGAAYGICDVGHPEPHRAGAAAGNGPGVAQRVASNLRVRRSMDGVFSVRFARFVHAGGVSFGVVEGESGAGARGLT